MNGDEPPRKKQSSEMSILSLPHDLILNIIARVSRLNYPTLSLVSKKIRSVVASPELYKARSLLNRTESCLYMCLRYYLDDPPRDPTTYWFVLCSKPNRTLTDGSRGRLFIPITSPHVPHERSMNRTSTDVSIVAAGSKIYKMGGYAPSSSCEVTVLDCRFNTWHSAPMMREKRSSPAASLVDGKIYVAGGSEVVDSENWVEVFDPKTQTWGNHVTNPGTEIRPSGPQLESFGVGGKLYLFGRNPKYVIYDPKEATWNPAIELGMGMDDWNPPIEFDMDMDMDMEDVASAVLFCHGVIGDVLFLWNDGEFRWYDIKASSWKKLNGVEDLPDVEGDLKMVDVGGKMYVLWIVFGRCEEDDRDVRFIWCAEIALERRGDEMWGNVEWFDVVLTTYEPCGLLDADVLSVTV